MKILNKIYVKRITVDNRTFRVEIYDNEWGLPLTKIVEEYRRKKNIFDFNHEKELRRYWVEDGNKRIEIAEQIIKKIIKEDKENKDFKKALDKWVCDNV